jgi:hypothetical protein
VAVASITDAECVEALRAVAEHGSARKAAIALGLNNATISTRVRLAGERGLSVDTAILTEAGRLKIALAAANRDVRSLQREADTAERIRTEIYNLAARAPEPPAWIEQARNKSAIAGIPMTIWSDWHYGEVVRPEEVGGANEFNAEIAAARIQMLVDKTVDLAFNHMGTAKKTYPGIIVMLGGDMLSGDIHEELFATNDRTTQQCINDLTDLLASALEQLANKFGKVFIPCVVGNHGRASKKPRMKGRVYCVTTDTPILTRDLRWVPAGALKVGDGLLAFQEEATPGRGQGRNFEGAQVTYAGRKLAHVNRVALETGEEIFATDEHKFLTRGASNSAYEWVSTADMIAHPRRTYFLPRMMPLWKQDTSWASGYLAGAFDADGCFQINSDTGVSVQLSQRDNALLARAMVALEELGFPYRESQIIDQWGKEQHTLTLLGGLNQTLRFLGTVRPPRLLANWNAYDVSQRRLWTRELVRVVSVTDGGIKEIAELSSSSKTYIAGGWPSHNTSHEWNIYCNLERHFRKDKRLSFHIPGESDAYFKVFGHRFLLTHGDSLGVKGGDGIIGSLGPIMRGSIKVGKSEAQIGREFDTVVMGHWHQALWLPGVIVNGALKGYDEYARLAIRAPYAPPSQQLWFVHPKYGITARWEILLDRKRDFKEEREWISWAQ